MQQSLFSLNGSEAGTSSLGWDLRRSGSSQLLSGGFGGLSSHSENQSIKGMRDSRGQIAMQSHISEKIYSLISERKFRDAEFQLRLAQERMSTSRKRDEIRRLRMFCLEAVEEFESVCRIASDLEQTDADSTAISLIKANRAEEVLEMFESGKRPSDIRLWYIALILANRLDEAEARIETSDLAEDDRRLLLDIVNHERA